MRLKHIASPMVATRFAWGRRPDGLHSVEMTMGKMVSRRSDTSSCPVVQEDGMWAGSRTVCMTTWNGDGHGAAPRPSVYKLQLAGPGFGES
jgi:hypothetical protein